jgi:hypothetical protein
MSYALTIDGFTQWKRDVAKSRVVVENCPYCLNVLTFRGMEFSVFCKGCNTHVLIEDGHIG